MEMARAFFIKCFILSNYYIYVHIKYLLTRLNEKKILARAKKKIGSSYFSARAKSSSSYFVRAARAARVKKCFYI
jgi:hypothetical protein